MDIIISECKVGSILDGGNNLKIQVDDLVFNNSTGKKMYNYFYEKYAEDESVFNKKEIFIEYSKNELIKIANNHIRKEYDRIKVKDVKSIKVADNKRGVLVEWKDDPTSNFFKFENPNNYKLRRKLYYSGVYFCCNVVKSHTQYNIIRDIEFETLVNNDISNIDRFLEIFLDLTETGIAFTKDIATIRDFVNTLNTDTINFNFFNLFSKNKLKENEFLFLEVVDYE